MKLTDTDSMLFRAQISFILFGMISFSSFAKEEAYNICYFSLNNKSEFKVMDEFTKKLNQHSPRKISVAEFLPQGGKPEEAFKKMIESGTKCDGLVISGHHTGSFGGGRADGSLSINFLEDLKCDKKYQGWFEQVQALWLQGCRTLGETVEVTDMQEEDQTRADFHMFRVGEVLDEDHLEQSFAELGIEFSATLDRDNPLSSRYLKAFPQASVFGWTRTAPGVKSHSEYSIPYHIAHISRLTNDRKMHFKNPIQDNISPEVAVKYADILIGLMQNKSNTKGAGCVPNGLTEEVAVKGWINHGSYGKHRLPFSFDNDDLMAYESLFKDGNPLIEKSREIDCLLKNDLSKEQLETVVDLVLSDERLLGYSLNSIQSLLMKYKKNNDLEKMVLLQDKLKNSMVFSHFMQRKLASTDLSLIRKIEYMSFLKEVTQEDYFKINKLIVDAALKQLNIKQKSERDFDLIDYKITLIQTMGKHGLLDEKTSLSIFNLANLSFFNKAQLYDIVLESGYLNEREMENVNLKMKNSFYSEFKQQEKITFEELMGLSSQSSGDLFNYRNKILMIAGKSNFLSLDEARDIITSSDEVNSILLPRHLGQSFDESDRLKIYLAAKEKYGNNEKLFSELNYSFLISSEKAEVFPKKLIEKILEDSKEDDANLYNLNQTMNDVITNSVFDKKAIKGVSPDELLKLKIEILKTANGKYKDGGNQTLVYFLENLDLLDNPKELLSELFQAEANCDEKCLSLLSSKDQKFFDRLEMSQISKYIIDNIKDYGVGLFLRNLPDQIQMGKVNLNFVYGLIDKADFSKIDKYYQLQLLRLLQYVSPHYDISAKLTAILALDNCSHQCRNQVFSALAKSKVLPPNLSTSLIDVVKKSEDDYDLLVISKAVKQMGESFVGIDQVYENIEKKLQDPSTKKTGRETEVLEIVRSKQKEDESKAMYFFRRMLQ